jgi:hypothetical protein
VLDQIITENYFQYCLDYEGLDSVYNDFLVGRIDSVEYLSIRDSLVLIRKKLPPKCRLDYADEFQLLTANHNLDEEIKLSIAKSFDDPFVNEFLTNKSAAIVVDTLSQIAQLDAKDLVIDYLEIVPYDKKTNRPYGDGLGVISFSKPYFNENASKAILFYEFNCGPKCGVGEVVFLERKIGKWRVVQYRRMWDS